MSQTSPTVSPAWQVVLATLQFTEQQLESWLVAGLLPVEVGQEYIARLRARRLQWTSQASETAEPPSLLGIIPPAEVESSDIQTFRGWKYLETQARELKQTDRRLSLAQFHVLESEIAEHLAASGRKLASAGIAPRQLAATALVPAILLDDSDSIDSTGRNDNRPVAEQPTQSRATGAHSQQYNSRPGPQPSFQPASAAGFRPASGQRSTGASHPNLLELLLDPKSIQWLLGLGGALMVVGLVILLWINEFFTPPVMAVLLGVGNLLLLGAGYSVLRWTKFQMAGQALSLLACLVMPLNLWYYSSNELITLDGHLWIPAVIISGIYAATAMVLRDEKFVYVLMAGVALTGLLLIADLPPSPSKFWEIPYPATWLVLLGLLGIHVERAFAEGAGPFSRSRFGLAFFWSGHVGMGMGLLLLLAAHVTGDWLYDPWLEPLFTRLQATPSPVCGELRWLSLLLVAAATYAYVYSDLVVRRLGLYIHLAACTLLWAEVLLVQMLSLELGVDAVIAILTATSLLVHVVQAKLQSVSAWKRSFPALGVLLGMLPVAVGGLAYLRSIGFGAEVGAEALGWTFVAAMLLAAAAARVGAYVYRQQSPGLTVYYFFATGTALMVAAASAMSNLVGPLWQYHAPALMLIPIGYMLAAQAHGDSVQGKAAVRVAHAGAALMLASSLGVALGGFHASATTDTFMLWLALFFAEAAVFYALAAHVEQRADYVTLVAIWAGAGVWQVLSYFELGPRAYILVCALAGLLLQIGYRLAYWEKTRAAGLSEAFYKSSNSLLSLAFVSASFYGLFHGLTHPESQDWGFSVYCLAMLVISCAAWGLSRQAAWRRWYLVTSLAQGAVLLLALQRWLDLSPWQQMELFFVLAGSVLLIVGHLGWYREKERQSDLVSSSLWLGSLMATLPLALTAWMDRSQDRVVLINELGFLFMSLGLLASGIVFKLKSTTLVGGVMSVLYFATLLILIDWHELNGVAIAITLGGSVLFGLGLVLAVYREQIRELPGRIRERKGVFGVLNWR